MYVISITFQKMNSVFISSIRIDCVNQIGYNMLIHFFAKKGKQKQQKTKKNPINILLMLARNRIYYDLQMKPCIAGPVNPNICSGQHFQF